MGDSHVRRMGEFKHILDRKLGGEATATLIHRGGSGLRFVRDNLVIARDADLLVVMSGGNDLDRGVSEQDLIHIYEDIVIRSRAVGVKTVAFLSHWTRRYMCRDLIKDLNNNLFDYFEGRKDATFWRWDKRLRETTLADGVHLKPNAYRRANFYVVAPIVWSFKHLL